MDCRNAKLDAENFNPRSPHGERHGDLHELDYPLKFQSTLPARGATRRAVQNKSPRQFQSTLPARGATAWTAGMLSWTRRISIHAPRTGSDLSRQSNRRKNEAFQSTLPARGATAGDFLPAQLLHHFNPRSPHGERLLHIVGAVLANQISIHAPRTGSDVRRRLS